MLGIEAMPARSPLKYDLRIDPVQLVSAIETFTIHGIPSLLRTCYPVTITLLP
jgi:hypothetical protein